VMVAGPVISISLACLFLLLVPFGGIWVLAGTVGFSANLLEAVYSLMPFHPLDGKGIAGWNKFLWVLIFLPAIVVYLVLYTL
jgi:Zn-dependent protease